MTRDISRRAAALAAAGAIGVLILAAQNRPAAQGFGGPQVGERAIVGMFDKNGDGRLDAAERKAARTYLGSQGGGGDFFGGFRRGRRGGAAPAPGPRVSLADVKPAGSVPLYDTGTLRTIFLQFEGDDWEAEMADFYNTDVEVPAVATVDGRTYPDVGVHFRGQSSFRMTGAGSKRSLNLSFDFARKDQRLLGYRTLNLLNVAGDPTFVRSVLYAEIANRYIAAPKANFVRVVINGEYWGVYVSTEQFNADFVRDRFGSAQGGRWKAPGSPGGGGGLTYLGEDLAPYKRLYEIKSRDDAASWAQLVKLCRVLNQTPLDSLEAALAPLLDVDGVLKFLAIEVVLVNSDGYWSRGSDYSLYQDPKGRFHVVPHDTNEALTGEGGRGGFGFGGFGGGGPTLDPLVSITDADKPLRSRLLAIPALRARYLEYVRQVADRGIDWSRVAPIVAGYRSLIEADVRADTRKLFTTAAFEAGLGAGPESLQQFLERRRAFLLRTP